MIALIVLGEWVYFGIATPAVRRMHADFQIDPREFDWPYPHVMGLHWAWCIPVGIGLAALILWKDRALSRRMAILVNVLTLLASVLVAALWIWGTVPHRLIQTT